MKRRLFLVFSVLTLAIASFLTTIGTDNVEANTSLQKKIKSIQEERSDNQAELGQKEKEIQEIERKLKALSDEIRAIDHQTAATNQQIREKDQEIEGTKERIEDLVAEIQMLEIRIAERDDLLKNRVRSMYKNGGSVNYLEVILGSRSFGDLVNRISALSTIAQQDRNILEAHHNDKMAVEAAKVLIEDELTALEDQLAQLEVLKETLEKQRKEKDRVMAQLEQQEGELHAELGELEEADEILAAQERAMKQELAAWQERQKRLEEERKRAAELAARNGTTHSPPPVTAQGTFMRPTTGNITSPYGFRWGKMHHGIDIGKGGRSGDVHVVAVEAGTVIRSYYSPSYGNTVMISHNVDGQVITTLYAHLENRYVADGQRVEKGQLLGYMGNTGRSFGAHLHFEVHEGPWNGAKSNAVDPMRYIPR
ncbi:murein hydrolase activator EnvC family protein [Anaerobacillus isosaccharinicus]|uniref:Peptidase M23 n=1 Tax=Anaerobacillus isosaccharinicus TaxID=1532552 RepID=A0A1S2MEZ2_9BACI|nr:peptidoglycan DD-metalloendopeptidase family protein [Anaerobacillus isosaccharinicus]MBA5584646.1 peptidoglycan DD-metalloendopeptidase family protein [Anaerobacillus isosaccharinicus]QOY36980.1 peptidoglycan DD-metalloendopeptidase family protein [Anaerobacillus isosaccharinicus]